MCIHSKSEFESAYLYFFIYKTILIYIINLSSYICYKYHLVLNVAIVFCLSEIIVLWALSALLLLHHSFLCCLVMCHSDVSKIYNNGVSFFKNQPLVFSINCVFYKGVGWFLYSYNRTLKRNLKAIISAFC